MNSKGNGEVNMASELPAHKFIPSIPKEGKKMVLISSVLVILSAVIIGAILIGVYITQEHTEKVIKSIKNGKDGQTVEQTVMVNDQESVAAFFIKTNTTAATVVYDYKHRLIGFRVQDQKQCSVVRMDFLDVPNLKEVIQTIEHPDKQGSGEDNLVYSFKRGKPADRTKLGTTINILCGDVPTYWAEKKQKEQRLLLFCMIRIGLLCLL